MTNHRTILLTALLFCVALVPVSAQTRRIRNQGNAYGMRIEKKVVPPDSATLARRDSMHFADSVRRRDSVEMLSKSSLETPAFSNARDSIVEVFKDGARKIFYYGDVTVKYQNMSLTAAYMEYDMKSGTVFAKGVFDTVEQAWTGRPVLTQDGKTYNMEEVRYNFDSRKARITNMITEDDDAILHGQNIKMMEDKSINLTGGKYTVCDADHPHYYLALTSAKVITKPSKKTIFGPAYLVVEDVKIPFIGLPFGFIPERPKRSTGILFPTFGEEEARGFYFQDMGMYFVFGDYLDLSVTGDYYSLGSWAVDINSRYTVKYKFNGNLSLNYGFNTTGEKGTPEFMQSTDFGLKWSHSQDSKSHPGVTFSASVNFSSPKNNRYNSRSIDEALQNQTSSSISFSKRWESLFSLSINALHNQNTRDSSYTFTLPNLTFSMSTIYPFKNKNRVGKEKAYEKISFGYNTSLQNRISFKSSDFGKPGFADRFQNGMQHSFSIGLPNFQLFKYINFAPSVSYGQLWFFRKQEYAYNPQTDMVEPQESHQFNTLGITQSYSLNASLSTRLYGMFNFNGGGKLQAIRHVISPSVSFQLSPDLKTRGNGYRTLQYTDIHGAEREYQYNIYSMSHGQMYSPPSSGKSASASINIGNNLEAKVRDFADTTGTGTKKIKLIDQFNINTGYNFLADSLNMRDVSMNMSTNLFDKVNITAAASFSPYALDDAGRVFNKFALAAGQGLLRLNNVSASASVTFNGEGAIKGDDGSDGSTSPAGYYQKNYYHPVTGEYIPGGWLYYTNPNVPWSVNLGADFSLNKQFKRNIFTATMSLSGNVKLTPKMSINFSSGFDFVAMKISTTQVSATYDLHCFNISVSWVPTGTYKSYSFRIAANAAALADLLRFKKSESYWDNF